MRARLAILLFLAATLAGALVFAQSRRAPGQSARGNVPVWETDKEFPKDTFTFARIRYKSWTQRQSMRWDTDYPDSDLNLSYRLQQMTAMRVDPQGKLIELTDPDLYNYPFIFMSGVGGLEFDSEDVKALRAYLLRGGFLLVDDFWGPEEWNNFYREIKKVLPDHEPVELGVEHEIFRMLFPLKEKPQMPNIYMATRNKGSGITWERPDAKTPHYKAIFDKKGRMMALIMHNTDTGDGWEEEATDPWYFKEFSEKKAFPLGINILLYIMTH
ncbi:MAG TPA: DUF4159 domain-containing protein [Methylomirabilota bacterium]|nr:DUF4159 domain-containing protein [Methylomirabilota bacterium]